MIPQSQVRKPRNSSKVNLVISAVFHGVILLALFYFAAREGLLGTSMKKIAVEMVKEKPPEKPKEPEKKKEEEPKIEAPKVAVTPKMEAPKETAQAPPPSGMAAPPAVAPPAVDTASFDFDPHVVVSSSDPVQIYKGLVEYSLHQRWDRPDDLDDHAFVAEVEVAIDHEGRISDPIWKKNSGNQRWDDSVGQAIARTASISQAPPTNFPPRVVIRFDVVEDQPIN